jgi:hypothetical protein
MMGENSLRKKGKPNPSSKKIKKASIYQKKGMVLNAKASRFSKACPIVFVCPYCHDDRVFNSPQSLGGHIAKLHRKMSEKYAIKQKRRNERVADREILRKAKDLYVQVHGPTKKFIRSKLEGLKNIFREMITSSEKCQK